MGQCAAGLDTPGLRSSATCRAGLAERESQQARAQHHKAGCGQREEAIGNKVVITHDTPSTLDARPNLLKLSESAFLKEVSASPRSGPRAIALKCVGKENPGSKQSQESRNRLNHRKCPLRPRPAQNDMPPRTVKRIPCRNRKSGRTDDLGQQIRVRPGMRRTRQGLSQVEPRVEPGVEARAKRGGARWIGLRRRLFAAELTRN